MTSSKKTSKSPSLETTSYPINLRSEKTKKSRKSVWMMMATCLAATVILSVLAVKWMPRSLTSSSPERVSSRTKRSPLVSSSSSFMEGSTGPASLYLVNRYNEMNEESALNDISASDSSGHCRKRSLSMCSGQVPFNSTTYPNFIGDENEVEASRSLPYFNYIAKSRCNKRIKQLLCAFLEPECTNGRPVPPCKKFCRIALEGCAEFVPQTLELSAAFDCRRYPDSTDPRVCVNLAVGPKCAVDEFQCPDRSCIPRHWVCDGVRDCIFAADEANCNTVACSSEEFECDRKCVPASWRCDGDRDCADGTDELNCSYRPGCGPDRFRCADGFGCIPKRWVCDGKAECRDGSDEMSCSQKECTQGDFKCDNGICIPGSWVCDGGDDCKDNSDERACSASSLQALASGPTPVVVPAPASYHQTYSVSSHSNSPSSSHSSSVQSGPQARHDTGSQATYYTGSISSAPSYQTSYTMSPNRVSPASLALQQQQQQELQDQVIQRENQRVQHQREQQREQQQRSVQQPSQPIQSNSAPRFISYTRSPPMYAAVTRAASFIGNAPSFQSAFSSGNLYRRISQVQSPLNHPFFGHSNHHVYRYFFKK